MKEVKEEGEKGQRKPEPDEDKRDIFSVEEIEIEEMAIDGICGVY